MCRLAGWAFDALFDGGQPVGLSGGRRARQFLLELFGGELVEGLENLSGNGANGATATVSDSLRVYWSVVNDVYFGAASLVATNVTVTQRDSGDRHILFAMTRPGGPQDGQRCR